MKTRYILTLAVAMLCLTYTVDARAGIVNELARCLGLGWSDGYHARDPGAVHIPWYWQYDDASPQWSDAELPTPAPPPTAEQPTAPSPPLLPIPVQPPPPSLEPSLEPSPPASPHEAPPIRLPPPTTS